MSEPEARIDTLRLSFDVQEQPDTAGATAVVRSLGVANEEAWTFTAGLDLPTGGRASLSWGVSQRVQLEFSVPKAASGDSNVKALALGPALEVAREVYDWASVRAKPAGSFDEARINRLDLVRDFEDVAHVEATLRSLAPVKQKGRAATRLFRDSSREGALTLVKGNNARGGTLYDKAGEVRASKPARLGSVSDRAEAEAHVAAYAKWEQRMRDAEGRLRFEARMRRDPLRAAGVGDVRSLLERGASACGRSLVEAGEVKLQRLRRSVWDWCQFGREVSGMGVLVETVLAHEELSASERMMALGYLVAEAHGQAIVDDLSRNTRAKYRRIAEELGLVLDSGEVALPEDTLRLVLDYEAGRVRLAGAA